MKPKGFGTIPRPSLLYHFRGFFQSDPSEGSWYLQASNVVASFGSHTFKVVQCCGFATCMDAWMHGVVDFTDSTVMYTVVCDDGLCVVGVENLALKRSV